MPFQRLFGAVQLVPSFFRAGAVQLFMGKGVAFKVDKAAFLHFVHLRPGEIVRIGADEIGNQEDGSPQVVFLQNGEGTAVIVRITIVKGNDNRLVGKGSTVIPGCNHFFRGNGMIAIVR